MSSKLDHYQPKHSNANSTIWSYHKRMAQTDTKCTNIIFVWEQQAPNQTAQADHRAFPIASNGTPKPRQSVLPEFSIKRRPNQSHRKGEQARAVGNIPRSGSRSIESGQPERRAACGEGAHALRSRKPGAQRQHSIGDSGGAFAPKWARATRGDRTRRNTPRWKRGGWSSSSRSDGIKNGEEQERATAAMRSAGSRGACRRWRRGGSVAVRRGSATRRDMLCGGRRPKERAKEKGRRFFHEKGVARIVRGSIVKWISSIDNHNYSLL
jgi:hypothetical protein